MDRRLVFLLQRAARLTLNVVNERLMKDAGISAAQLAALAHMAHARGTTPTELASLLSLRKSAVTGMLGRLERDGLVERAPTPGDGRSFRLLITDRGEAVRQAARDPFRKATQALARGFSPEEMEVVLRFLNAVIERLDDRPVIETPSGIR